MVCAGRRVDLGQKWAGLQLSGVAEVGFNQLSVHIRVLVSDANGFQKFKNVGHVPFLL